MHLSETKIESFCGDVLPLSLLSDGGEMPDVVFTSDSDAVAVRDFRGGEYGFSDGVLLILNKVGCAKITASCGGEEHAALVTVRERRVASEGDKLNYYIGDLHDHTSKIHNQAQFAVRECDFPIDMINQIKEENLMDFSVVSDHGDVLTKRDFFRGFCDAKAAEPMDVVIFPGSESEATVIERDRFGFGRKNSGEIVVLNSAGYSAAHTWQEFYDDFASSPLPVATFAHPQVVGCGEVGGGIWNFKYSENNTPEMLRMMRLVEMGNGGDKSSNLIQEYAYSQALDAGFKVSVSCSSDSHGPEWGYRCFPGKTVIMSPEKSREMFLDAILSNRVYASESGNLKLDIKVNGKNLPCELDPAVNKYDFDVSVDYFKEDADSVPVKCSLVSDNGNTVSEFCGENLSRLSFSVESSTARYFYFRFVDSLGRKTWSPPAYCGREIDKARKHELKEVDKSSLKVTDEVSGLHCGAIISGKPAEPWFSNQKTASIVVDMGQEREISAIGHYAHHFVTSELREKGMEASEYIQSFVSKFRVSVSFDGKEYTAVREGKMRAFGGEEIIDFKKTAARFLRFDVLSTVGRESCVPKYMDANVSIGELSIFE